MTNIYRIGSSSIINIELLFDEILYCCGIGSRFRHLLGSVTSFTRKQWRGEAAVRCRCRLIGPFDLHLNPPPIRANRNGGPIAIRFVSFSERNCSLFRILFIQAICNHHSSARNVDTTNRIWDDVCFATRQKMFS